MNPLKSITGTLVLGFVTAIVVMVLLGGNGFNLWSLVTWLHVFAGVIWIGLLYYFNFVQAPAVATGTADSDGVNLDTPFLSQRRAFKRMTFACCLTTVG